MVFLYSHLTVFSIQISHEQAIPICKSNSATKKGRARHKPDTTRRSTVTLKLGDGPIQAVCKHRSSDLEGPVEQQDGQYSADAQHSHPKKDRAKTPQQVHDDVGSENELDDLGNVDVFHKNFLLKEIVIGFPETDNDIYFSANYFAVEGHNRGLLYDNRRVPRRVFLTGGTMLRPPTRYILHPR